MSDSSVAITAGSGINIDTRIESTNSNHRQVMVIGDPATNAGVAPVDATTGLKVNLGANNNVTLAAGATAIGKAEDVASADSDVGVPSMAVQKATPANTAGTDGDYEFLQMSAGRLWASAKIDTALPAGTNAIGKLAANSGVIIGDVNVVSAIPGTGASSIGKADSAAHTASDVGTMSLAVRRDANTTLVTTDGYYAPLQVNDTGALKVAITSGAGSGGTSIADQAAFTTASTSVTPIGGLYKSSEDALSTGQAAAIGIDVARNVKTHEQYAPTAEDNDKQVIAQQIRPVSGTTYAASTFAVFGTNVALSAKATAGNLFSIYATNINGAIRYLQVHNKASAPASTNVPVISLPIPAGTATVPGSLKIGRDILGEGGHYLDTGVSIGISTTEATFTAATTTDHDYYGQYK